MDGTRISRVAQARQLRSLGMTYQAIADTVGTCTMTIWRWEKAGWPAHLTTQEARMVERQIYSGSYFPTSAPRLGPLERCVIEWGISQNLSCRQIAQTIGFSHTTISREIARHGGRAYYQWRTAQNAAMLLARRPKIRKLDKNYRLRKFVVESLLNRWSPKQISKRLETVYPTDEDMRVCHETIYQSLYVQGKGSLRQELAVEQALRSGRKRRLPTSKLPRRARARSWVEGCEISRRPAEASDRAVPGHWEGDLIIGGDMKSCLVTLVERKTRFLVVRRLETHDTKTVVDLLIEMCADVPDSIKDSMCSTLTWDQGVEMADAARFTQATGFKVYFCDPHSPWQKGSNENTNGLIRQYFPKGTKFTDVTDEEIKEMQDQLNGRPRETLGWYTPAEMLAKELVKAGAMTT